MSLSQKYISASIVSLIGKIFNMISMLGILWLLNDILGKEAFGVFMVAFSLGFTIAMIIGSGFQALLIYHIARLHENGEEERIRFLTAQIFWATITLSALAALPVYLSASALENIMDLQGLSFWLPLISFFIPAHAAAIVLPSLPRARHNAEKTTFYQEILLNALRLAFLFLIWLIVLPQDYIAYAYIASAVIPVLILFAQYPLPLSFNKTQNLTLWDAKYVAKISLFQILNQPFRGFDILLVGAFASAGAAADYTMASRLAQLLWIPKHALSQLQVPRMGGLLDKKNYGQLMQEYNAIRTLTTIMVLLGCSAILWFSIPILNLFGDYANALPPLLLLAAASLVRTGAGSSGDILGQSGHAGWSAVSAFLSLVILIAASILFIPLYGAYGAAMAALLGTIALFAGFAAIIKRILSLQTWTGLSLMICGAAIIVLNYISIMQHGYLVTGFFMAILAILMMALDRSWYHFLKDKHIL